MKIERVGGLWLVRFAPAWLRVLVPPAPMTGRQALAWSPEALAIMDGAMFSFCAGQPHDYARAECSRSDYGLVDGHEGIALWPKRGYEGRGGTISVVKGAAVVSDGWAPAAGATVAWQGYPAIVRSGRVLASSSVDANRTERAGCGRDRDGRLVFASMVSSMLGFAEACRSAGLEDVLYSDGGESRVVAIRAGDQVVADLASNLDARRVPVFLAAVPPLL